MGPVAALLGGVRRAVHCIMLPRNRGHQVLPDCSRIIHVHVRARTTAQGVAICAPVRQDMECSNLRKRKHHHASRAEAHARAPEMRECCLSQEVNCHGVRKWHAPSAKPRAAAS